MDDVSTYPDTIREALYVLDHGRADQQLSIGLEALDRLEAQRDELARALRDACDVAIWMSGSPSFGPEGEAREGWVNEMRPKLETALSVLASAGDAE